MFVYLDADARELLVFIMLHPDEFVNVVLGDVHMGANRPGNEETPERVVTPQKAESPGD